MKFIYSEKATKFCEISTLPLFYVLLVKSKEEILQNFVAFSEYINFNVLSCFDVLALLQYKFSMSCKRKYHQRGGKKKFHSWVFT